VYEIGAAFWRIRIISHCEVLKLHGDSDHSTLTGLDLYAVVPYTAVLNWISATLPVEALLDDKDKELDRTPLTSSRAVKGKVTAAEFSKDETVSLNWDCATATAY
jgi:hypothetical protein